LTKGNPTYKLRIATTATYVKLTGKVSQLIVAIRYSADNDNLEQTTITFKDPVIVIPQDRTLCVFQNYKDGCVNEPVLWLWGDLFTHEQYKMECKDFLVTTSKSAIPENKFVATVAFDP
jgi:hypothetical protein